jgi:hypothetical protein
MQSIICTYHGPTNTRGSRITAKATGANNRASVSVPYNHALSHADVYWEAANKLAQKLGWTGTMQAGNLKPDNMVFVFLNKQDQYTIGLV